MRPLGTNFSEILIKTQNFLFMQRHLKMAAIKFCPGGDELKVFHLFPTKKD